jgi:hypothetical protein
VASGKYACPEDVVAAAVISLDLKEQSGEFEAGQLDTLLAEGEQSIVLDGDEAFRQRAERRALKRGLPQ